MKYAAAVYPLFADEFLVPASWKFVAVSSAPRDDLGFAVSKQKQQQQQVCLKNEAQVKTSQSKQEHATKGIKALSLIDCK